MKKTRARVALSFLTLALGLLVFVVFSHMRPMLDGRRDMAGRAVLVLALLLSAMLARRGGAAREYGPVLYAFFAAALAMAADYYLPSREWLLSGLKVSVRTPAGAALDKLESSAVIISVILLLTKASRESLASIYLRKGSVKKSLAIGAAAFLFCAAGSVYAAGLFGARGVTWEKALRWSPWILVFVLGNALNEELLFRGLFLRKLEPFAGRFTANLLPAVPFALHHTGVDYTDNGLAFLAILLPLSLAWGSVTQKTDSLWGAVLFHAGTDIPVALAVFSSL